MLQKFTLLFICFQCSVLFSQQELNYPTPIYGVADIHANWVSHPKSTGGEDSAVLFRNKFTVDDPSEDFIINITADNHYFLYVNGVLFTHGPQLSDIKHWKYETLNLKSILKKGENIVAVKVVNFGKRRFLGMQSIFTSLMVNGVSTNAKMLTTTGYDDNWKCFIDESYKAIEVIWRGGGEQTIVGGFYANNPTDFVDMNFYPTNWEQLQFNDSSWQKTQFFEGASSMGGSIAYMLEPRNLPLLTWEKESVGKIKRSTPNLTTRFPETGILEIPAQTKTTFLIDKDVVTNGFPELLFSGGKDASIKIKYAENLFGPENEKGNRDDITNKKLLGYYDHIISNGNENQKFTPNWMRTFRFIEFEITTKDKALTLHNFVNYKTRTQIASTATFISDNEMYNRIFEICKRTVDICTQDYFLSDAYYETMQYVGDSKIQALLWQAMSGNLDHTRNAILQFHQSRDADGNILGAYPLRSTFIYPTYSLVWVDMIANYYNLTGDTSFINQYKNGISHTLEGFDANRNTNNLVDKTPYRYFIDWYVNPPHSGAGTATDNGGENSAIVSLHYAFSLQNAAKLFDVIGDTNTALKYKSRAEAIKKSVYDLCFDTSTNLFAERPDKTVYDQHTNIMAILTDAIPIEHQKELLNTILQDKSLLQATYYYRYYLFKAIKKVNAPELFDLAQKPWETMIHENMTTTLERFESKRKPTRSEVHPWSASPAIFYFDYLAGITSIKNNFEEVEIAPVFGKLKTIKGTYPTPRGTIAFNLEHKKGKLIAEIDIPINMKGILKWGDQKLPLLEGKHNYKLQ